MSQISCLASLHNHWILSTVYNPQPYIPPNQEGIDFDSDASDSSDDEDYDDDLDPFGPPKKHSLPQPGETEHTDPSSFSWCLMRYAFVKLVLHKIQTFLPTSGIELAGKLNICFLTVFLFIYLQPQDNTKYDSIKIQQSKNHQGASNIGMH